jgi:hypothetical protein
MASFLAQVHSDMLSARIQSPLSLTPFRELFPVYGEIDRKGRRLFVRASSFFEKGGNKAKEPPCGGSSLRFNEN